MARYFYKLSKFVTLKTLNMKLSELKELIQSIEAANDPTWSDALKFYKDKYNKAISDAIKTALQIAYN